MKSKSLLFLFLAALGVRVFMLVALQGDMPIDWGLLDTAKSILGGHGFSDRVVTEAGQVVYEPTVFEMPGHALVIASLWKITGSESLLAIELLQMVIDSFFVYFVFLIGERLYSKRVGLLAALLFAVYLPEAYLSIFIKRDVWVTWAVVLSFLLFLKYMEEKRTIFALASALVIAVGIYFNPSIMFLPAMFGLVALPVFGFKKTFVTSFVMMGIVVLALMPWIVRNYGIFGKIIPTRGGFYQTIWEGFGEFPNPFGAIIDDEVLLRQIRAEGFEGRPATVEFDEFIKPKVKKVLTEHPGWYAGIVLKRIPRAIIINRVPWGLFQDRKLGYNKLYANRMEEKTVSNYLRFMIVNNPGFLLTKFFDVMILFFAIIGVYLSRDSWRRSALLLSVPAYFIGIYIPMHVEGKYMVPSHWVYLLFMSVALVAIKDRFSSVSGC